ncbi:MAG TPA: TlpA disulfide reductase family protein [Cyclobacteriaceae bacterium]|nr:TlpA disulfide reductase family protein [Cyclobacteriaceae bacterium]HPW62777.1 TlpA disulfide reductase family protein [Cyclobacteriaceae bacterium]
MKNFIGLLKTGLTAVIIIGLLKVTGLMGDVSYLTQTVAMKAGVLDVSPVSETKAEPKFDYAFTIKDLNGNKLSFEKYKGKVVFLNLWATWCGPCKAEMPGIHNLYVKMKGEPIEFVMLSIDKDKAISKVESYVKNNSYTFPVFMPSGYLAEQLQVPSIPTTFVISKEGLIVMKEVGTRNYDTKKMMEFLKKQAAK